MYVTAQNLSPPIIRRTDKRSLTFLCQGNVDPSLLTDKGWSAIIILESANYNEVFDIVQNTFKAYRKWEESCRKRLCPAALLSLSGHCLLGLFACRLLINCIGRFVFSAGELSASSLDSVWDSLRYKGIFPMTC